jgi:hypothetical protein
MYIKTQMKVALFLALTLTLIVVGPVAAQESEPVPCVGEGVSGTIVAVDEETGTATIDTGDGLCTVVVGGEYEHPIVVLLGEYFGDTSAGDLTAAQETTQGCAIYDPGSGTWAWADCDAEGAVAVTVKAENEDGTFTATATVDGEEREVIVTVEDPAVADDLSEALQTLTVEWDLGEDGAVTQTGDEIASYHEDGMGFGVLVKLYAIAAEFEEACADAGDEPCGATVEELVAAFRSGQGMGQLFKEYGRPSMLGVGHVKQQMRGHERGGPKDKENGPPDHASPKENNGGPPDHAGPKKPKPKKNK